MRMAAPKVSLKLQGIVPPITRAPEKAVTIAADGQGSVIAQRQILEKLAFCVQLGVWRVVCDSSGL